MFLNGKDNLRSTVTQQVDTKDTGESTTTIPRETTLIVVSVRLHRLDVRGFTGRLDVDSVLTTTVRVCEIVKTVVENPVFPVRPSQILYLNF